MIAVLLLFWLAAIAVVPAAALVLQAWFLGKAWREFNLAFYLGSWAIVAFAEILGIVSLTGESMSVLIVGFWSTVGAIVIGGAWWLASRVEDGKCQNG